MRQQRCWRQVLAPVAMRHQQCRPLLAPTLHARRRRQVLMSEPMRH
jgi:hypothetical protein